MKAMIRTAVAICSLLALGAVSCRTVGTESEVAGTPFTQRFDVKLYVNLTDALTICAYYDVDKSATQPVGFKVVDQGQPTWYKNYPEGSVDSVYMPGINVREFRVRKVSSILDKGLSYGQNLKMILYWSVNSMGDGKNWHSHEGESLHPHWLGNGDVVNPQAGLVKSPDQDMLKVCNK